MTKLPIDSLINDIRSKQQLAGVFEMIEKFIVDTNITNWYELKNVLNSKEGFILWFSQKFYEPNITLLAEFAYEYLTSELDKILNNGISKNDIPFKTVGVYKKKKLETFFNKTTRLYRDS